MYDGGPCSAGHLMAACCAKKGRLTTLAAIAGRCSTNKLHNLDFWKRKLLVPGKVYIVQWAVSIELRRV